MGHSSRYSGAVGQVEAVGQVGAVGQQVEEQVCLKSMLQAVRLRRQLGPPLLQGVRGRLIRLAGPCHHCRQQQQALAVLQQPVEEAASGS